MSPKYPASLRPPSGEAAASHCGKVRSRLMSWPELNTANPALARGALGEAERRSGCGRGCGRSVHSHFALEWGLSPPQAADPTPSLCDGPGSAAFVGWLVVEGEVAGDRLGVV